MTAPLRSALLEGRRFHFSGLSENDPYFRNVGDGIEPELNAICRRLVRDDDVILDIGANIGVTALLMSQFVPNGRVIAVEAGSKVFGLLSENIARNESRNVVAEHCAISDQDGTVTFAEDSAYGHIAKTGVTVPAKRLQTLSDDHALQRADLIKIDVEGFEPFILKDSLDFINERRSLVLLEFNSWSLTATSGIAPLDFSKWLLANFSHVFMVRRGADELGLLERIGPDEALKLLHLNMVSDTCVSDILVTNAPERLNPSPVQLARQLRQAAEIRDGALKERDRAFEDRDRALEDRESARQERDRASEERDRARQERNEANEEKGKLARSLWELRASTSWKLTAPLRKLVAAVRSKQ